MSSEPARSRLPRYSSYMASRPLTGPDLTLILSVDGVIQEAIVGANLADESLGGWVGRRWESTVADVGPKKVRRLLETAREQRVGGFSQITQQLPSGREILMEYSAVRSDTEQFGIVAIGKNLGLVVEQQQKLVAAQQEIERNYWKLRDIENRYQAIIKSTSEAVVLIRELDLTIVEANSRARELLDLPSEIEAQPSLMLGPDTVRIENILSEIRRSGQAPSTLVHLNQNREEWRVKATAIHGMHEVLFLLQFVRVGSQPTKATTENPGRPNQSVVIVGTEGTVQMASESFADLTGTAGASELVGEDVNRWLGDLDVQGFDTTANAHECEARLISTHGSSRPVKVLVYPLTAAISGGFALAIESPAPMSSIH